MSALALILLASCKPDPETPEPGPAPVTTPEPTNLLPMPEDLDEIDFVAVFQAAAELMVTVNTQQAWLGHTNSIEAREPGCPDLWTGPFTSGGVTVGQDDSISWFDDCKLADGGYFDGYVTWEFDVVEFGDLSTYEGRTSDAFRLIEGDGVVGAEEGLRYEFDGTASDSLYQVQAYGYERFVYSSTMDATVTGTDVFTPESLTPEGFRTDLFLSITGGDVETFSARGSVYMFTPQLFDRFDSIEVDMELKGDLGAAPTDCLLEPLGWIGVRDPEAYWYDVVFLPRYEETITGEPYENPLSVCDGCGQLYVQGVEQEGKEVCIDFDFLFDSFPLPDPDDYVLPIHAL